MGNNQPKVDAGDFADRLNSVLESIYPDRDGRGAALGRLYGVTTVNANDWLNGHIVPKPLRVLDMAERWGVSFMWLYFGRGEMKDSSTSLSFNSEYDSGSGSRSLRSDWHKMQDAQVLLRHLGELRGVPALEHDPRALTIAYDFLLAFDTPMDDANVLDLTKRINEQLRGNENDPAPPGEPTTS